MDSKPVKLVRETLGGVVTVEKTLSVKEIEKALGFDSVQPIRLTPSDEQDTNSKEAELRDWYEDELKAFYESTQ